ncbi:MAG: glycyl-radical enzyme activator family protein, partial [Bacteroidetes bacterium]|nr:glycyl-radical enzyme activator family protein [Bacteroidota bacterium]
DRCVRCGDCFDLCKNHAVQRVDGGFSTVRDVCVECGECSEVCNAEARQIAGKSKTEDEVMEEIEKDVIFYEHSGGGASFSGGEPLLQHEFLCSLLEACNVNDDPREIRESGAFIASLGMWEGDS